MSTLTYSRSTLADATTPEAGTETGTPLRKSFWRRVYEGVMTSQQRRADREIAAFVGRHGGMLTDDVEREIMQRLSGGSRRSV